ncbi:UNVERIFIED_CONTAM: hypothetical protein FKN15_005870 [Acipenser sinensis]
MEPADLHLVFTNKGPPCSHLRATASEENGALVSFQASPQTPCQSTGVTGAHILTVGRGFNPQWGTLLLYP